MKRKTIFSILILVAVFVGVMTWNLYYKYYSTRPKPSLPSIFATDSATVEPQRAFKIGDVVDKLNGVEVYYNGSITHVLERNVAEDGYNLGLKYQCVEFVKRYYYQKLKHKMPDSYGDAKDFFDKSVPDGGYNAKRDLLQFTNPSKFKPQPDDLVIWKGNPFNPFGHVAIISDTMKYDIHIVQQNPGPGAPARVAVPYVCYKGKWKILEMGIVGWLRKK